MHRFSVVFLAMIVALVAACGPFAPAEPTPTAAPPATAPTAAPRPTTSAPPSATTAAPTPAAGATSAPAPTTSVANPEVVRVGFVATGTEARYRVREQLAGVSLPSDAIGKTKAVTGAVIAKPDGTFVTEQSVITVDLSTLQSNEDRRDNFLRSSVLQTNRFRNATFVPKEAKGLTLPIKDGPINFQLIGDLTIRNVTKPVTWDVKGTVTGNQATGQATTSFTFAYFNLEKPQVPVVLSVEDNIKLELDLQMRRE